MLWIIWLSNIANKGALTCLKLYCSLVLLMYFYTGCSGSGGGVAMETSASAESAPRAKEAGGESRLWADVLEANAAQWHM